MHLRNHRNEDDSLRESIIESFAKVTTENMLAFYLHCQNSTTALNAKFMTYLQEEGEEE